MTTVGWTACEAEGGTWTVQHSDGRRFTGFSKGEALAATVALNALTRIRTTDTTVVYGEVVEPGLLFDVPLAEGRELVRGKRAVFA